MPETTLRSIEQTQPENENAVQERLGVDHERVEREPSPQFTFALSGIYPWHESSERGREDRLGRRLVQAVAGALGPSDAVVFAHQRDEAGEVEWTLGNGAGRFDENLAAALASGLAAAGAPFQFKQTDATPMGRWTHRVELHPVRRTTGRRGQIGFGRGAEAAMPEACLELPADAILHVPVFASLGELVGTAPVPCVVAVTLTRLRLTAAECELLRCCTAALDVASDPRANDVVSLLNAWLQSPAGWRLACCVEADRALPEAWLRLIGNEVFGSETTRNGVDCDEAVPGGQRTLDLSACRPGTAALPRLFPTGLLLRSLRQRRVFNRSLPLLPVAGVRLGDVASERGGPWPLRLPAEGRDRHCYIVGATGTGKSTLLCHLIRQEIAAGEGVALIDAHGDLIEQVLAAVPPERAGDVVLFEPGVGERALGLNFLEVADGPQRSVQRNFVVNELLGIFDQIWDMRQCGGPMFQTYFHNALLLLMEGGVPGITLAELPLVFEDESFRDRLKAGCTDALVQSFWTKQAEKAQGESSLRNIAPYVTSKLGPFISSAVLRPIIGQSRSLLDFRRIMDRRGIFLANLSKGLLGATEARLLGMLLLGKFFTAGMSRASLAPERRTPFSMYVDEAQNFVSDTMSGMLAEARKFGLCLTLANQNLAQLRGEKNGQLLDAVLGNVGSLILFRLGPPDAEKLALYTRPQLDAAALERLSNFHAAARLLTGDGPMEPLVFRVSAPLQLPSKSSGAVRSVRRRQRRYTRPVAEVEAEIRARRSLSADGQRNIPGGPLTFFARDRKSPLSSASSQV